MRLSLARRLRALGALAAAALLAACAAAPRPSGGDGVAVDLSAPVPVALLAPLGSGDPTLQAIGRDLVNAAQLAVADLRDAQIDLRVYETRGTLEGGQAAASAAVAEGARIVVGPLLSTETTGAEPVTRAAGLQMLTFSNNPEVAAPGVYLLGVTPGNSASALVGYGRGLGLSNFGVLFAEGEANAVIRDSVVDAVLAGGGRVVTSIGYPFSQSGIGAAMPAASAELLNVGAQAVILTDRSSAGFVADGLRAGGLGADRALLMGLQPWGQDADTLARGSLQGAVYAAPDPGPLAAFEGRYANAYGARPHELAVLGYDGVAAVGAMIAEARSRGGSPFSTERITQSQGFAGANGAFRFAPNGLSQRNLAIVEVRNGAAVVVSRAARGFGALGN
jgi:ABC-type branched-subunit amino acid transport system substrate-binding protein